MSQQLVTPIATGERAKILDILRGMALLGICLANYPVFSLYVFQPEEQLAALQTPRLDKVLDYLHFIFIDGKFYTLFSLLFGIGFSVILLRSEKNGRNGLAYFYRRIFILLIIGFIHIRFLWPGDILLLYAVLALFLPLFRNASNKTLITLAVTLILFPIVLDVIKVLTNGEANLGNPFFAMQRKTAIAEGITRDAFPTWLSVHTEYHDVYAFNHAGFFMRIGMLLDNNRCFKVFGIFLIGYYVGRNLIYTRLAQFKPLLKKVFWFGLILGLPVSVCYAIFEFDGKTLPSPAGLLDTVAYALSVVPLGLAYAAGISLFSLRPGVHRWLNAFSWPGKMALTNYILQTVIGMAIFYGIGLGYGAKTSLSYTLVIATLVYLCEMIFSYWWLKYFEYGPLEWLWRQLTYGKVLPIRKKQVMATA